MPPAAPTVTSGKVLVSLSSLHYPGQLDTLQSIMDAVADLPLPIVVTTGNAVRPEELRRPPNVEIHGYVPHAKLMPDMSLLVGHRGHSTTMQALAHDLPVVIVPLSTAAISHGRFRSRAVGRLNWPRGRTRRGT